MDAPSWIKLIPLLLIVICTIVACIFNCKGKTAIFVNGWDMLLFLISAIAFTIGQEANLEQGNLIMSIGAIGVVASIIWSIAFCAKCHFNVFLIAAAVIAKLFFFFLFIVIAVVSIFLSFRDSRNHEYKGTVEYEDGSTDSWTISVPKSDVELEYYSNKRAESIAPLFLLFLSHVKIKQK